jgi:diacylglycerol O-acyltransferase-1
MLRKRLKSDTLGNMIFWASFCVLGQPMCLILYYHDYVLANMGMQGLAKAAAAGAGAAASAAVGSLAGEGVGGVVAAATAAR